MSFTILLQVWDYVFSNFLLLFAFTITQIPIQLGIDGNFISVIVTLPTVMQMGSFHCWEPFSVNLMDPPSKALVGGQSDTRQLVAHQLLCKYAFPFIFL